MIYSNFIEHLGDCIHNGIWAYDPVNVPLIDDIPLLLGDREDGVRKDVLQAVIDLKPTVLRAFGGCYSDVYHWKDAIGPRNTRKKVINEHWGKQEGINVEGVGPDIENQFGTDEFLTLCETIGAKPYLNVNYGSGTTEEAADWVEYCNGSIDTEYGSVRAQNGRNAPYNVKIWGIANEIYGFWEVGYEKSPVDYMKKYLKFAKKMREKDSTIKLVACGYEDSKWNQIVLKNLGENWVDYLSIHRYFPYLAGLGSKKKHPHHERCYHALMASTTLIEDYISDTWKDIVIALGNNTHVRIAFDEWGVWYNFNDIIKTNYNLQDGLWTALVLMTFQKMSDKCPMANWAQLINCLGTIRTDSDGLILTPVYLAFKIFVNHMENNLIEDVKIDCMTFKTRKYGRIPKMENVPYIECNANINDNGNNLSIMIVNKHFTENLKITLEIKGFSPDKKGKIVELTSDDPFDYNTISNRNKIEIREKEINNINSTTTFELPAHSVSVLKLTKRK